METFQKRFPIAKFQKLDDGRMLIEGVATDESLDSQGDILDYEGSKKAMGEWRGNVREAHDPRKPVGKALDVDFDDKAKRIVVKAFISSGAQDTQAKIQEGVLSCFSVGGGNPTNVATEKVGGRKVRRVLDWTMNELSVVDAGANPNAVFQLVKADGVAVGLEDEADDVGANRYASRLTDAMEKAKKPTPSGSKLPDKPASNLPPNEGPDEEKAAGDASDGDGRGTQEDASDAAAAVACEKCDVVHKDGVAECDKMDLAAANTKRAKSKVEAAKADHKVAQSKEALAAAKKKADEVKAAKKAERAEMEKAADAYFAKKDFSADDRKKLADEGKAMPDGSFPIENGADLENAIHAVGRAKNPGAAKAHIKRRAKALGLEDKLPDTWKAVDALLQKHYGGGEEFDIGDALSLVFGLKSLMAAEAAEDDEDESKQLTLLKTAYACLASFIELEAGELSADDANAKAVGGPAVAESMHGVSLSAVALLTKAAEAVYERKFRSIQKSDSFSVTDGELLAEGIGAGFTLALGPLSKALSDLGSEVKAVRANADIEKAIEGSATLKRLADDVAKIAAQPAVILPARNRQGIDAAQPATTAVSATAAADVLRKYAHEGPPETREFLLRCATLEERNAR
jgi:hypothetical protein